MNIKTLYGKILGSMSSLLGVDFAKQFDTRLRFHRTLNLKAPTSLADKVTYLELHKQSQLASICTDKYAVREYIRKKGLEDILIPVVGGPWSSVEDVDFDGLPDKFALKATHGCKMNYLVADKSELDYLKCKAEMQRWLETTYGSYSMEPHYLSIPHRIYAEEYLADAAQLTDYKFHCLNGEPQFVLTVSDRKTDGDKGMSLQLNMFDMNWNPIDKIVSYKKECAGNGNISKPKTFDRMVEIAKILSKDFDFVRVDLYERNDAVLFGELTFSPGCCVFPYFTQDFLNDMGRKLQLS